jgi:hypothetical protein
MMRCCPKKKIFIKNETKSHAARRTGNQHGFFCGPNRAAPAHSRNPYFEKTARKREKIRKKSGITLAFARARVVQ